MIRVLVADASERVRANLERRLADEADITLCGTAGDGEQALQEALRLTPDIAVIDAALPGMDGLKTTEMLAEYAPRAGIILMSMESGSDMFRRAMLAGAREVLQKPFTGDDLVSAIHRVHQFQLRKSAATPASPAAAATTGEAAPGGSTRRTEGRMVTIVSGKGGVGKSVVATNLALVLSRSNPGSVVLVDLSLQFGDVAALLDIKPERSIAELAESDAVADAEVIQQALTSGPHGLTILAAPASPELADYVTTAHLRALTSVLREQYATVVADATSQLSEITLESLENSDRIVLVTDLSVTSVKNTRLLMSVIGVLRVDPDRIIVVANHRDPPTAGGLDRARVEDFLKHAIAVEIPYDAASVGMAVTRGVPVVAAGGSTPLTQAFERLAAVVRGDATPALPASNADGADLKRRGRRILGFARD